MKRVILSVVMLIVLAPLLFAAPPVTTLPRGSLNAQRNQGLLITRVIPDTPAQRAGIVRGDILIELDGQKVTSPADVRRVLAEHNAGDTVIAIIIHGSQTERVPIKLETRLFHPILGVDFSRAGAGAGASRAHGSTGAYVDSVVPGGPAAVAGIQPGDVILSVNGTPVDSNHTLTELIHASSPGSQASIRVRQPNGQRLTLSVRLGRTSSGEPLLGLRYSPAPPAKSGLQKLFRNFTPPKWFRYFDEPLFPNQMKGGSGSGNGQGGASGTSGSA